MPIGSRIFPRFQPYQGSLEIFCLPDFVVLCDNLLKPGMDKRSNCFFVKVSSIESSGDVVVLDIDTNEINLVNLK